MHPKVLNQPQPLSPAAVWAAEYAYDALALDALLGDACDALWGNEGDTDGDGRSFSF